MENNIFEGAKFGDKFVTKCGKIAIFSYISTEYNKQTAYCLFENTHLVDSFELSGKSKDRGTGSDIISRYQELIDEDKLDELAYDETYSIAIDDRWNNEDGLSKSVIKDCCVKSYKAGYRSAFNNKAKEE